MPADTTWQDVAEVLLRRWPAGPGNKGWGREQLDGYIEEVRIDKLTPHWAVVGLRASTSDFIPSVGSVRRLAHEAMPPMTAVEIAEAGRRQIERRRAETPKLAAG